MANIDTIKKKLAEKSWTLVSGTYTGARDNNLVVRCDNKHVFTTSWRRIGEKNGCYQCFASPKLTIECAMEVAIKRGYTLLDTEYTNQNTKMKYQCERGHHFFTTHREMASGTSGCKPCAPLKISQSLKGRGVGKSYLFKKQLTEIAEFAIAKQKTLLSTEYIDNSKPLQFGCQNGHTFSKNWRSFQAHPTCPNCFSIINEFLAGLEKEKYSLRSNPTETTGVCTLVCQYGHQYKTTPYKFVSKNHRCSTCYKNRVDFKNVRAQVEQLGYTFSKLPEYENQLTPMHLVCQKGHEFVRNWKSINLGSGCHACNKRMSDGSSKPEESLRDYINKLGFATVFRDRKLIRPKELDIIVHSAKVALEFNGIFWHSLEMRKQHSNRRVSDIITAHRAKLNLCRDVGYRLISVMEDELLFKEDLVLSRLNHILGASKTIHIDQCTIREPRGDELQAFLYDNSFGVQAPSHPYGLIACDGVEPVGAALIDIADSKELKISDVAIKAGVTLTGGVERLINCVVSIARDTGAFQVSRVIDLRWCTGNSYGKSGFVLSATMGPTPMYYTKKVIRVSDADRAELTVYDCGHEKWVYYLD